MRPTEQITHPGRLARAIALAMMAAGGASVAAAEDKWWESNPYYEEDSWMDVTEWFDGNNYNPTDESLARWDDETYDAADDTGADADSDWDYDYTGASDYYSADVYPHTRPYGFDARFEADDWFYDYWDEGYASYYDGDGDGYYERSTTWHDFDGDGFYDSTASYYDWDDDGSYEDVEFVMLNTAAKPDDRQSGSQKPEGSSDQRVSGEITRTKKVSVKDTKHLVVELEKAGGEVCVADLGPAGDLNRFNLEKGSKLKASGPMVKVGDKKVLVAQKVTVDGNTARIDRQRRQLRGQVADTRRVSARDGEHLIAILATGKDRKTLVDLGPADRLKIDLQEDDQIEVKGAPAKINDRRILVAQELRHDGETYTITRGKKQQDASPSDRSGGEPGASDDRSLGQAQQSIRGNVQSTRTLTVRGNKRQTVVIKETDGNRTILVDLGRADGQHPDLGEGDRLEAWGTLVRAKNGRPVLLAKKLSIDGEKTRTQPAGQRRTDVSGEVVSTRTASIRDEQRLLAKVETDEGRTFVVDLGKAGNLEERPREGDQLSARGIAVKGGPEAQVILVAREFEHNGNSAVSIQRD